MGQITKAIEITAPIALVFDLLKPTRLSEWYGMELHTQVTQTHDAALGVGATLTIQTDLGVAQAEVIEFSAPAKFAWRQLDGRSQVSFLLFPVENTTSVQLIEDYRLRGPLGALADRFLIQKRSAQAAAQSLANLKRLAEWEAYQQRQKMRGAEPRPGASPIQLLDLS